MDLTDLYEKHQKNIEKFNALRDQAWSSMKEQHRNLTVAFGSVENLPIEYVKKFENDINNFNGEWANETGSRYVAMSEQHQQQIYAITGEEPKNRNQTKPEQNQLRPKPQKSVKQNKSEKPLTEREQRKQEFIRQQKAIMAKARQQQKTKEIINQASNIFCQGLYFVEWGFV